MKSLRWVHAAIAIVALMVPVAAYAQSSIAGVAKDSTGAVMPGVTVEAASPVLIEKVRAVTTDGQGQYKIINLPPGVYTVTFTLVGFNTVKRENLELPTSFTATVNADLRVGSLEETITVTGASPIVDVQNTRTQSVISRELLDTLPTGKNFSSYAALTVGATGGSNNRDVGGAGGESFFQLSIHGARADGRLIVDGLPRTSIYGSGTNHFYQTNDLGTQEVSLESGGRGAEYETGGMTTRIVPKDGGNRFTVTGAGEYTNHHFSSTSIPNDVRARGVTTRNAVKRLYDIGFGVGGPVQKDKMWFYTDHRLWGTAQYFAGLFYNKTQGTLFYTPDLTRQAYDRTYNRQNEGRLTWQATEKDKFAFQVGHINECGCHFWQGVPSNVTFVPNSTAAPEAGVDFYFPDSVFAATWTRPTSRRLLFEAGFSIGRHPQDTRRLPETSPTDRPVLETTTGMLYGAAYHPVGLGWEYDYGFQGVHQAYNESFAMSYVTGSHAFKVGFSNVSGTSPGHADGNYNDLYIFTNQRPIAITSAAYPVDIVTKIKAMMGVYAQDQWTINRLTLNLGIRFDYLNAYDPEQTRPAGFYLPAVTFAKVENVPNWKDVDPRLGVAYDVFGNGKTAVKAFIGRYLESLTVRIAQDTNPINSIQFASQRTWNDNNFPAGDPRNGNYVPDCDLKNQAANGECGPGQAQFGSPRIVATYDPSVTEGYGKRGYNWQGSLVLQQELRPGLGVSFGYYRTSYGNLRVADNTLVTPNDFTTYCVTAPVDPRLPGGGGNQICDLYDVNPDKFGRSQSNTILATGRTEVYNGFDILMNARFGKGGRVSGGLNTGNTKINNCPSPDVPAQFCNQSLPWGQQTQVKFSGSYPLPYGIQASAVYQNLPGIARSASAVYTNAQIAPLLGRNLAACGTAVVCNATATISLLPPNQYREPRSPQLDVRLSKVIRLGGHYRFVPRFDVYNLTNTASMTSVLTRFGATWLNGQGVLTGRLYKFGGQIEF